MMLKKKEERKMKKDEDKIKWTVDLERR